MAKHPITREAQGLRRGTRPSEQVRRYRVAEAVRSERPVRPPPALHAPAARPRRRAPVRAAPRLVHPMLGARDPGYVEQLMPLFGALSDLYYRAEAAGTEHLSDRASLIVSTHNGGAALPDTIAFLVAWHRRFGAQAPLHGLVHKIVLRLPGLRTMVPKLGGLPASHESGQAVLTADRPLLVMPGGDLDALKPFRERHTVTFGPRRGFIRLALRNQVPIVPVVSVGAHETFLVLNDGRWLAKLSGLERLMRVKTVPLALSFPFGLTLAGVPSIPLPSKIKMKVLPPIELHEKRTAAEDPRVVERCFEHVRATMQRELDALAAGRKRLLLG
ncbi:MAG TPA: hypothetical protein DFS52_14375 [Myxococcales bacterium]|nr:hypothetical protein [Myxococcales bacterium]